MSARLRPLDWVVLVNCCLFAVMVVLFYWDRLVAYRRSANLREFFVYACVYAVFLGWLWSRLRTLPVRWRLLVAGEFGLLFHFAGGLRFHAGRRLYDVMLLDWGDFRFDKLVHVVDSVVVGLVVGAILRAFRVRLGKLRVPVMLLAIVGAGALWEIAEYLVVKSFPDSGVGGYDNNMQDMIANLAGACVYVLLPERWRLALEEAPPVTSAAVPEGAPAEITGGTGEPRC